MIHIAGVVWIKEYPKRKERSQHKMLWKQRCVVMKPWGLKEETCPAGKFKILLGNFLIGSHITWGRRAGGSVWASTGPCWDTEVNAQRHQEIITLGANFAGRSKMNCSWIGKEKEPRDFPERVGHKKELKKWRRWEEKILTAIYSSSPLL